MNLETDRLILRTPSMAHVGDVQRHFSKWSTLEYMSPPVPWPYPDDGAEQYFRDVLLPGIAKRDTVGFALSLKGAKEVIGMLSFKCEDKASDYLLGFWLAEEHRGQGLMSEAVSKALDFFFEEKPDAKVFVRNAVENIGSHRVQEKCGFLLEGVFDKDPPFIGGSVKEERWRLDKSERTEEKIAG